MAVRSVHARQGRVLYRAKGDAIEVCAACHLNGRGKVAEREATRNLQDLIDIQGERSTEAIGPSAMDAVIGRPDLPIEPNVARVPGDLQPRAAQLATRQL
eukprot:CAMPEP_0119349150 /NCGR_PEP_ID=MMETSP1333-20130426/109406_1 /TAXON_ID=418940 /ORGANISM="Scyphosphaera apsteinii, Strain RCC1455" /LENGTH=99 /DNA_ID=CAMNT_0007361745 /DNA_START=606 /DNA_END=905 /DNA_ORIENTATION=-